MKRRKQNPIGDYLGASIGLSVTGSIIESIGGPAQAGASKGITAMSNMLPTMGTIYGAGMVLGATQGLTNRRRYRR